VQGAGAVGADLVRYLLEDGSEVLVSDVDEGRAAATGASVVAADEFMTTECDVYAPCAVGGTLNAGSIPRLRCRIAAGCANNQLATPEDGDRLHEAGILYAPDYAINAGGVLQLLGLESLGWDNDELERRLAGIGDTLRTLYREADEAGITPAEAAELLAARRLGASPAE
jgi:leucine dehydrogenase